MSKAVNEPVSEPVGKNHQAKIEKHIRRVKKFNQAVLPQRYLVLLAIIAFSGVLFGMTDIHGNKHWVLLVMILFLTVLMLAVGQKVISGVLPDLLTRLYGVEASAMCRTIKDNTLYYDIRHPDAGTSRATWTMVGLGNIPGFDEPFTALVVPGHPEFTMPKPVYDNRVLALLDYPLRFMGAIIIIAMFVACIALLTFLLLNWGRL